MLFIDLDHNGVEAIAANLLMLGVPREALTSQRTFRYCEPDSAAAVINVVAACRLWRPDVAVIDSVGELLPLFGADSNSADDYTTTSNRIILPLTNVDVCVISIDHLAKALDSRAYGPGGTMAKRRMPGGASIRVKKGRQFAPGKGGSAKLFIHKDRHGGVRKHCPPGREQEVGTFVLDPPAENDRAVWRITMPFELLGNVIYIDDESLRYLEAASEFGDTGFDLTDLAALVSGDVRPGKNEEDRAHYYVGKLLDMGSLTVLKPGGKGRSNKARWKVVCQDK